MGTETWTYATSNQVTITGDFSGTYWPRMKVKLVQDATTKHFLITDVNYADGSTVLTFKENTGYEITSSAITQHFIDKHYSPKDFEDNILGASEEWDGWLSKEDKIFINRYENVKTYDAIGDGVADDTDELQAAIDAVLSSGKALFVPSGTYNYDALVIDDSITIIGERDRTVGNATSILNHIGTGSAITIDNGGWIYKTKLIDLALYGTLPTSLLGLDINILSEFQFINTTFVGFGKAISAGSLDIGQLNGCYFTCNDLCLKALNLTDVTMRDCNLWENTAGISLVSGYGNTIISNHFEKMPTHILIDNADQTVDLSSVSIVHNSFLSGGLTNPLILSCVSNVANSLGVDGLDFKSNTILVGMSGHLIEINLTNRASHAYFVGSFSYNRYYNPSVAFILSTAPSNADVLLDLNHNRALYPCVAPAISGAGILSGVEYGDAHPLFIGAQIQANSTASDVAALVADFNLLLAKLRALGILDTAV